MLSQVSDSEKKSFIKINLGIWNDLQVFHRVSTLLCVCSVDVI